VKSNKENNIASDVIVDLPERKSPGSDIANCFCPYLEITRFSNIKPVELDFIWPGFIAIGKITVLVGNPGLGKTMLAICMASHVSTGKEWPGGARCPIGDVGIMSAEDGPDDTLLPRLIASKADVSRVHFISMVKEFDIDGNQIKRGFSINKDLKLLEECLCKVPDCRLIIIDPISAYMGGTDTHNNSDVRGVLSSLSELASSKKVAILAITHMNKGGGSGNALFRVTGSLAFVAAARAAFLIEEDKDDDEKRLFVPMKNNLGNDKTGFSYRILEDSNNVPFAEWDAESINLTAADVLMNHEEKTDREEAAEWLYEELGYGECTTVELITKAKQSGHSWSTVKRAKLEIKVEAFRKGYGEEGRWYWRLPTGGTFNNSQGDKDDE